MNPTDDQLAELAELLSATTNEEIDCDVLLNRVAAYLHATTDRRKMEEDLRQVGQHLKVCPECREEFEALFKAEGLGPADFPQD